MSKKKHSDPPRDPASLALPRCGVDSHAHLDMKHFGQDLDEVLARARAAGLSHIGNVFLSPSAWAAGRERFAARSEIFFLLGIHPTDGNDLTPDALAAMKAAFLADSRLRAVGEIGLDFYWKDCDPDVQREAFRAQLHLARQLEKPVVIHSRDAFADTVAILEQEGFTGYPLLWHCFGGDVDQAASLVGHGWHVSIPGPVTFPANHGLREAAAAIPLDRLLLETDCPYLAPVPFRGKRNEPAYTAFTAETVAAARGMDPAELWRACGDNARQFFGIKQEEAAA